MTSSRSAQHSERWLPVLAFVLLAIALPLYAVKVHHKNDYTDFDVYYKAAVRLKQGLWDQVYNLGDGSSPFRYAPPWLLFFRPFAELPADVAKMAWYALQVGWFALGFWAIHQAVGLALPKARRTEAGSRVRWATTSFALLFVLRFCLDCFTIGQVSSLLFAGYCLSLYAWMSGNAGRAGAVLLIPAAFKIGPGFLYGLFAASRTHAERTRALLAPLLSLALATSALWIYCAAASARESANSLFVTLWKGWGEIVANDSGYFDASHYGSQSVKSAILRAVKWEWISTNAGHTLYLTSIFIGCGLVFGFWALRQARGPRGRGLFFALGVFPYLWFMPETFKYSLTVLAIPAALLWLASTDETRSARSRLIPRSALALGVLALSLPGLDVVGEKVFFALQYASVPLIATFALAGAVAREAWLASRPRWSAWAREEASPAPWPDLPVRDPLEQLSLLIALPLQSHSAPIASQVHRTLLETHTALKGQGRPFEILVSPHGDRVSNDHPALKEARRTCEALNAPGNAIRVLELRGDLPSGRGAALRQAFLQASGTWIGSANIEQPCGLDFYPRALEWVQSQSGDRGTLAIAHADRRHPGSRFLIPVRHLKLVYGRHRLGRLFNRLIRMFLPIQGGDTHSGSWLMTRELAKRVFARQRYSGFLFDLEMILIAQGCRAYEVFLPVRLQLENEKSPRRIGLEMLSIALGLPRLAWRNRAGYYGALTDSPAAITADDWGLTPGVNAGILELARRGIVRRVSLMARSGYLREGLDELKSIPGIELGLHFDLTYGKGSPGQVLLAWLRPGADRARLGREAAKELEAQLTTLQQVGAIATYLDGHHHIHLVPGMIQSLDATLTRFGIRRARVPYDPSLWFSKPQLAALAWFARPSFRRLGLESLRCFYPQPKHFADPGRFRARLGKDLAAEVIVHPADREDLVELGIPDPYTTGRVTEFRALRMLELR